MPKNPQNKLYAKKSCKKQFSLKICSFDIGEIVTWDQFQQHTYPQLLHAKMIWLSTSISPTFMLWNQSGEQRLILVSTLLSNFKLAKSRVKVEI